MPEAVRIAKIEEPVIMATILTSDDYLGGILPLLEEKRGIQQGFEYIASNRVMPITAATQTGSTFAPMSDLHALSFLTSRRHMCLRAA